MVELTVQTFETVLKSHIVLFNLSQIPQALNSRHITPVGVDLCQRLKFNFQPSSNQVVIGPNVRPTTHLHINQRITEPPADANVVNLIHYEPIGGPPCTLVDISVLKESSDDDELISSTEIHKLSPIVVR